MCEWGATRDERAAFVVVVEEEAMGVGVDVVAFILTGDDGGKRGWERGEGGVGGRDASRRVQVVWARIWVM